MYYVLGLLVWVLRLVVGVGFFLEDYGGVREGFEGFKWGTWRCDDCLIFSRFSRAEMTPERSFSTSRLYV